ncbi:hypothetical protein [Magnetococcus marinus]|uniref:hypothetical protein n=1 Tax=Magnetococcus marinus TaxID=1124597 RepID=UPI000303BD3E|nr:hypothetical protein [Magnetococcus marinus]
MNRKKVHKDERICTMCGLKVKTDSQKLTFLCEPCRAKAASIQFKTIDTKQSIFNKS